MQSRSTKTMPGQWPSYANRRDAVREKAWRRALWQTFWLLVLGKLFIMICLAVVAFGVIVSSEERWTLLILLNWSWIVLAVVVVVSPIMFWSRLYRARRKRKALIHAEWHV